MEALSQGKDLIIIMNIKCLMFNYYYKNLIYKNINYATSKKKVYL